MNWLQFFGICGIIMGGVVLQSTLPLNQLLYWVGGIVLWLGIFIYAEGYHQERICKK